MSAKSKPGDGTHGKGAKGGRAGADDTPVSPFQFLKDLVRGLWGLRRL